MIKIATNNPHKAPANIRYQTAYTPQLIARPRPFYAKQTQFAESLNEHKYPWIQGLYEYMPSRTVKKQTQFQFPHRRSQFILTRRQHAGNQPHHPRTTQPTIKMQNKPNFGKQEMNLTTCGNKDYEHKPPLRTPPKQTQFRIHRGLRHEKPLPKRRFMCYNGCYTEQLCIKNTP